MNVTLRIVNAFVDNNAGGNPAGVVLDADQFTTEQKLLIASKAGYSETAFISRSSVADFKLDFFTPTKQIPHCGHATIASFSYLQQLGRIHSANSSKETIDGTRKIILSGELAFMEQLAPKYISVTDDVPLILEAMGITKDQLQEGLEPMIVNTGNSFLIIPLKDAATLALLKPKQELVAAYSERYQLIGFYPFSFETSDASRAATTRMFAPYYGIDEESATGMAAGPLACYLFDKAGIKNDTIFIEQGHFMNPASASILQAKLSVENGSITGLMVGGKGMVQQELILEI